MRRLPLLSAACLFLSLITIGVGPLFAAPRAERLAAARELVAEALHCEIYGDAANRARFLKRAEQLAPNLDEIRWHRGEVRFQDQWQAAEDVTASLETQPKWKSYERRRAEHSQTLEGQLELANWCRDHGLPDQERAHLVAALDFAPNHAEIRQRLGFRQVNGTWVTVEQLVDARERVRFEIAALRAWRPKLEEIRRDLSHRSQSRRDAASRRIAHLDDHRAIPAMEAVLSNHSEHAADLVLDAVAAMRSRDATLSLVRHGVFSPWQSIRTEAAERLRQRDLDNYAPVLLSSMYTPVVSRAQIARGEDGEILFRHAFLREGQDARQLLVLDTAYHRISRPGGSRNETLGRALSQLSASASERRFQVAQQNLSTSRLNERIAYVLEMTTGEQLPATPTAWWQWWNERNEVFVAGEKTLQTAYRSEQVAVSDRPVSGGGSAASGSSGGARTSDCLAAGTPVWTGTGMKAIERIEVGDLVLAQDPATGELAFKPVLQTTVRPAGPLVRVRIGNEWLETSGGHLFWVSGEGWTKARELEPGMEVHTPTGTRLVRARESGSHQETYNLVVADFATYFVGPEKLLSHDNTVRQPVLASVPGLVER